MANTRNKNLVSSLSLFEIIHADIDSIIAAVSMVMDVKKVRSTFILTESSIIITYAPQGIRERVSMSLASRLYFFYNSPDSIMVLLETVCDGKQKEYVLSAFGDLLHTIKSISEKA